MRTATFATNRSFAWLQLRKSQKTLQSSCLCCSEHHPSSKIQQFDGAISSMAVSCSLRLRPSAAIADLSSLFIKTQTTHPSSFLEFSVTPAMEPPSSSQIQYGQL